LLIARYVSNVINGHYYIIIIVIVRIHRHIDTQTADCFLKRLVMKRISGQLFRQKAASPSCHSGGCEWIRPVLYPHYFLDPRESALRKQHLDRFTRFCSAHERDQQTNTQRDHATPYVAIGHILYTECMVCGRPENGTPSFAQINVELTRWG